MVELAARLGGHGGDSRGPAAGGEDGQDAVDHGENLSEGFWFLVHAGEAPMTPLTGVRGEQDAAGSVARGV